MCPSVGSSAVGAEAGHPKHAAVGHARPRACAPSGARRHRSRRAVQGVQVAHVRRQKSTYDPCQHARKIRTIAVEVGGHAPGARSPRHVAPARPAWRRGTRPTGWVPRSEQEGLVAPAHVLDQRAPRVERAAGRRVGRIGHLTDDRGLDRLRQRGIGHRHGRWPAPTCTGGPGASRTGFQSPSSTIRPRYITATRSLRCRTIATSWLMNT